MITQFYLPINKSKGKDMTKRKPRKYGPFFRNRGEKKWIMLRDSKGKPYTPMRKELAVRHYQDWLLQSALGEVEQERQLRPLTDAQLVEWQYWLDKHCREE